MTIKVHHLRPAPGAKTAKTRVGRGEGSKGKTAGRGTKGSKARKQISAAFEVLGDSKKRKLYDEFGEDAMKLGFDEKKAEQYRAYRNAARAGGGHAGPGGFQYATEGGGGVSLSCSSSTSTGGTPPSSHGSNASRSEKNSHIARPAARSGSATSAPGSP